MKRILAWATAFGMSLTVSAATFTVDWKTGDDVAAAADVTRATPFATIQAAVDLTVDNDVVRVKPGTYDAGIEITKAITLEATSSDPADTVIDGKGTSRCVYGRSSSAIVRGFTLNRGYGQGGGFYASDYSGAVIADCVIRGCTGGTGPSICGGRAVRCRILDSMNGAVRYATIVNCLLARTTVTSDVNGKPLTTGAILDCYAYNCTFVDNACYTMRASACIYNSVILQSRNVSAGNDTGLVIMNSVASPWENKNTQPGEDSVGQTDELCFFAPAAGDYRPMAGSVLDGRGDAALLANVNLPEGIDPYVDLAGRPIPKTGAIAAGAFQEVMSAETCSGLIVFTGGNVGVDGYRPVYAAGYYRSEKGEFHEIEITGYPTEEGAEVVGFRNPDLVGGAVFPDMDEKTWILTPPNGVVTTNEMVTAVASHVLFVDPEKGNDDNDGQTAETPVETIVGAMGKITSSTGKYVIHAAAGTYTNGNSGISRFTIIRPMVRVKGAGAGRSFIYGRKATGTDDSDDGRGADACRIVYSTSMGCVQGFTLANGYTEAGDTSGTNRKGGIAMGSDDSELQITDCELRNGWSARGAIVWNAHLKRCRISGQKGRFGQAHVQKASLLSCLIELGSSTDQFFYDCSVFCQSTVYGNGVSGYAPVDPGLRPQNAIIANTKKFECVAAPGCLLDASGATCTKGDAAFVNAAAGDYRLLSASPAMTCGEADPDVWKHYSRDLNSKPLVFVNGNPIAGALQNPVAAVVTTPAAHCGIEPAGVTAVEAGESVMVSGVAGKRPALDLIVDGEPIGATTYVYTAPTVGYVTAPVTVEAVCQTNLYVNADATVGKDDNDGLSPDTPRHSFAGILPLVLSGDTVHAAAGTYDTDPIDVADCPNVKARLLATTANVRFVGDEGAAKTFIVGAPAPEADSYGMGVGATRCVYVGDVDNVTIAGFTLTGGRTVHNDNASGSSEQGGAVCAQSEHRPLIVDCIISNNVATWAAAARFSTLLRCRVTENKVTKNRVCTYGCNVYNCFFDYNRGPDGQGLVYSASCVENCTFGAHNYTLSGTTLNKAVGTPSKDMPMKNCVVLCGNTARIGGSNGNVIASNCAFANWPVDADYVATDGTCVSVTADCIDDEGRPAVGSALVNAGTNDVLTEYADYMATELGGGQRVYDGTIDIGCYEYDWRPAYSIALGAKVTAASAGVKLVDGVVRLGDGDTLSAAYAGPVGKKSRAFAQVMGDGALEIAKDGEYFDTVVAADGLKSMKFRPAADVSTFDYAFGGDGSAVLGPFSGPRGMMVGIR